MVDACAKSSSIFAELEVQYGFIGGPLGEYLDYFTDLICPLICGDGLYGGTAWLWLDFRRWPGKMLPSSANSSWLFQLTMPGGIPGADPMWECREGRPSRHYIHTERKAIALAACDEINAFTKVLTPSRMWPWIATPPLRAGQVWNLLPAELQLRCTHATWESAQYMCLAMGCSHSGHILMTISLRYIGIALISSAKLSVNDEVFEAVQEVQARLTRSHATDALPHFNVSDDEWWSMHASKKGGRQQESGVSLDDLVRLVRAARMLAFRVFTVCIAFSGARRKGDIHDQLEALCLTHGIQVLIFSLDVATDHRWDLSRVDIFSVLLSLSEQGFIDFGFGVRRAPLFQNFVTDKSFMALGHSAVAPVFGDSRDLARANARDWPNRTCCMFISLRFAKLSLSARAGTSGNILQTL